MIRIGIDEVKDPTGSADGVRATVRADGHRVEGTGSPERDRGGVVHPDRGRWRSVVMWALGPALLGVLLAGRTLLAPGLEPAIGLPIAATLLAIAVVAARGSSAAPWLLLVGPIALVTSPARTELAFNLARPREEVWFAFTVVLALGAGLSIAAAAARWRHQSQLRLSVLSLAVVAAAGFAALIVAVDPQPDQGRDLAAPVRDALPEVTLLTYGYSVGEVEAGTVEQGRLQVMLVNDSELPHTLTVDELDVSVYVPAGRQAVLDVEVPADAGTLPAYCAVGDHREQGMTTTVRLASP